MSQIHLTNNKSLEVDDRTTAIVNVQPRIKITYDKPVNVEDVNRDIGFIMQFWGLMIGRVSEANDIRLTIEGQELKCWLYLNRDFSYNLRSTEIIESSRTNLTKIGNDIQQYFSSWYSFCSDEKYEYIRRMYFFVNNSSAKFAEEIFLQYIKILEGYSLHETSDENIAFHLEEAIKKSKKEIKHLIFNDTGKALFESAFREVLPDWKFNSGHADQIADWIATGYIGKKGLAARLKELDSKYMNLLTANAVQICQLADNELNDSDFKEAAANELFKKIVVTRNYFSHFKADNRNILNDYQWHAVICSLKALTIAILYSKMGMSNDVIRRILMWDSELHFQTCYLRKPEECADDCLSDKEAQLFK